MCAAMSASSSKKPTAVVLMSGGMDSCVTAAIAGQGYALAALHASYGQRSEQRELRSFHAQADACGATRRLAVKLSYFRHIGGSSLTDRRIAVPDGDLSRHDIPNTYVPFRNAHFLAIATSWAEVLGARRIFIGAVWDDSSGYPDCRPEYYEAMNRTIRAGTRPSTDVTIETPLIHLRKADIVRKGLELGAPFELTWSCYQEVDLACGRCASCALRLRAFAEAGADDPIGYIQRPTVQESESVLGRTRSKI